MLTNRGVLSMNGVMMGKISKWYMSLDSFTAVMGTYILLVLVVKCFSFFSGNTDFGMKITRNANVASNNKCLEVQVEKCVYKCHCTQK